MDTQAQLPVVAQQRMLSAADFKPIFEFKDAIERHRLMVQFTKEIMKDGVDYGTIPGTNKPTLFKPGAERLCTFFGLCPEFITEEATEDWTGERHRGEPFFYYRYKCILRRNGIALGEGIGSCNTFETKYRYRWVPAKKVPKHVDLESVDTQDRSISEPAFAIEKGETTGKYGKPAEYWERFRRAIEDGTAVQIERKTKTGGKMLAWEIPEVMYRVPNTDVADAVNTCQKMAQKRALVAAVLIAVNASEFFTQDLEDLEDVIEGQYKRESARQERDVTPEPATNGAVAGAGAPPPDEEDVFPEQAPARQATQKATTGPARTERTVGSGKTAGARHVADVAPPPGMYENEQPTGDDWTTLDTADALKGIENAATMVELTNRINAVPTKHRGPDTLVFKAFMKRREYFASQKTGT